jgi:hypothetical protein
VPDTQAPPAAGGADLRTRRRRTPVVVGLTAVLALSTVAAGAWHVRTAPCHGQSSAQVPMPSDGASPGVVVSAFIAALDAGDYATVIGLLGPDARARYWDQPGLFEPSYYGRMCQLSNGAATSTEYRDEAGTTLVSAQRATVADVTLDVDLVATSRNGLDDDWPDPRPGFTLSGPGRFSLVRHDPSHPWRIVSPIQPG